MMKLEDLGYTEEFEHFRVENALSHLDIGRVILEHKERYIVKNDDGDFECELLGKLRYSAEKRSDFPVVGDWVAISSYDEDKALIHYILPRYSVLERQAVGRTSDKQVIASNIDYGMIVLAVNRDFNINRVQRYMTICNAGKVKPVLIISKIDLITKDSLKELVDDVNQRLQDIKVFPLSNTTNEGLDSIRQWIDSGKTYCLLGSSGVGKSTLLNNLLGEDSMKTGEISDAIDRGKHVTSHRELWVLDSGGIIIDNPGMREVGITASSEALETTFEQILTLSENCKFRDCRHINESGCAILEALEKGEIDEDSYQNFQKMERERAHYESSIVEKRQQERSFSKMVRNVIKEKKKRKF